MKWTKITAPTGTHPGIKWHTILRPSWTSQWGRFEFSTFKLNTCSKYFICKVMIWDKMNTHKIRITNYIISTNFVTSKTKYWRTILESLERYDLFRYYNMRFHTTLSLKIKTTIGDAWIRQNWFFLGKIPNSLWSPPPSPPSFRNFSLLFFCKYALIYVNLQWHFLDWRWPPPSPPFWTFFPKFTTKIYRSETKKSAM